MTSNSGILSCSMIGSNDLGQITYAANQTYAEANQSVESSIRFRTNTFDDVFDVGFFPIKESGSVIYDTSLAKSGVLLPSLENFEWKSLHRHGELPGYFSNIDNYLYGLRTLSGSGYVNLNDEINLPTNFGLYFHINTYSSISGVLFSRGTALSKEFEIEVLNADPPDKEVRLKAYDIYNQEYTLTITNGVRDDARIFMDYKGNASSGIFELGNMYSSSTQTTGYIYPRKIVSGSKSKLFKSMSSSESSYNGWLHEFGAKSGEFTLTQQLAFQNDIGINTYPDLKQEVSDTSYIYQYFPYGTGIVNDYFNVRLSKSNEQFYEFLSPLSIAPSSSRINMTVEHITNHSGVVINPSINFYNGTDIYRTWCGQSYFLPSGVKQDIIIYPNSSGSISFENYPTITSNITSALARVDISYDNNNGTPYDSTLKVYSVEFEVDGYCVASQSILNLYLYNNISSEVLNLYSVSHSGLNKSLNLYTANASGINILSDALYPSGLYLYTAGRYWNYNSFDIYMNNTEHADCSGIVNLYTYGPASAISSGIMNLYLYQTPDKSHNELNMYLANSGITNTLNLYLFNDSKCSGTMNLFIEKGFDTVTNHLGLYLHNFSEASGISNLYMYGMSKESGNPPLDLYLYNNTLLTSSGTYFLSINGKYKPGYDYVNLYSHGASNN